MHRHPPAVEAGGAARPRLEVADIFRAHGGAYRKQHPVTAAQAAVMAAIIACRTSVLGGHLEVCPACGFERPAYNSCRNRHCPKCQSLRQARWVAERQARILPTHYFHVVFTVPPQLRALALCNRELFFNLLFAAASRTLLELGQDPERLGARLGLTAVLHTWTRDLQFHPHLHVIVTGGGLSADKQHWVPARRDYLFPAEVLSALFRGKLLAALDHAYRGGELSFAGDCAALAERDHWAVFKDTLYRTPWVVYAKPTLAGPEQVFRYLGRYTQRVAISNQRLISLDERGVTLATKNGATVTLRPEEFIRRFLLHVLPPGFVKIRHYGLLAPSNATTTLETARQLLVPQEAPSSPPAAALPADWKECLRRLTGIDPDRCPACGHAPMLRYPLASPIPPPRAATAHVAAELDTS